MKVLSLFVFILGILVLWSGSIGYVLLQEASPVEKLESLWNKDIHLLKQSKALPPAWDSIDHVEFYGGTETAKNWLSEMNVPVEVKPKGLYTLEVLLVDWKENQKAGAMIQYNLVEQKSGNMVWELGRTLILNDDQSLYRRTRKMIMNWLRH